MLYTDKPMHPAPGLPKLKLSLDNLNKKKKKNPSRKTNQRQHLVRVPTISNKGTTRKRLRTHYKWAANVIILRDVNQENGALEQAMPQSRFWSLLGHVRSHLPLLIVSVGRFASGAVKGRGRILV